jgi:hypothetical protein
LTASDGAIVDQFGRAVSVSGNTALIGSYLDDDNGADSGSAYVFQYNVTNGWIEVAKLTASDGAAGDQFGRSVSVSGNTAVIGSYFDDDVNMGTDSGSAYVFEYSDVNGWVQVAKLTASDGAVSDRFGLSVSVSNDTIVVGSYQDDDNGTSSGSAYVFQYNSTANSWTQVAKLTASDGAAGDYFGWSVAVSGDTALVGSYGDDDMGSNSGSAYVFQYNRTANSWAQVAKLTASDGAADDQFGFSVSVSGNSVVVGSYGHDDQNMGAESGSAYVFQYSSVANGWVQVAKLTASDGDVNDQFGWSVSVSGNTTVIGSYLDDHGVETDSGSAYVFKYSDSNGWAQVAKLSAGDGKGGDRFGYSVAVSGDTAVIGSYWDDNKGLNSGSAYVFGV